MTARLALKLVLAMICPTISSAMSTLELSSAPLTTVPNEPEPGAPVTELPDWELAVKTLPPLADNPPGLLNCASSSL